MSVLYNFVLTNWLMGKPESYVDSAFILGYITEEERLAILSIPKP